MERLPQIMIVEDDFALRHSLRTTLTEMGFKITEASTGEEALLLLRSTECETVLLDINMPGIGGIETCGRIRHNYPVLPILMLTVRDNEDDKVEALDAGADDYITKPFHIRELAARLRSSVRRYRVPPPASELPITIGAIRLDRIRHRVEKDGAQVHLTPKEFDVLRFLMENAGRPMAHTRILAALWGPEYGNEREYLRVVVSQLRKKLEEDPTHPHYLLTDSYIGYRFREI